MKTIHITHKPLVVVIHIISWLLIFCFPIAMIEWDSQMNWLSFLRHYIVPLGSFILFYINYLYLTPRYFFQNRIKRFLILNGLLIVCMSLLIHFGHTYMMEHSVHDFRPHLPPPPYAWHFMGKHFAMIRHLVMMSFVVSLSTAIQISLRWRQTEKRLIEAEKQKADAELKNLKNQLNPHFLLNTLNNIYALITFNGEKAKDAVLELSKLLRHVLYDNQSTKVSLEKELNFINNYISLMKIRLPASVKIDVKLDAGPSGLDIAPLIFISLIENAFKHGISPTEESFISIHIQGYTDGKICCEIINSNFPKSATDKSGSGIGLEQVSQRLELTYPNKYEWKKGVSADGSTYTSILTIQSIEV